jgi:hypothetical protein
MAGTQTAQPQRVRTHAAHDDAPGSHTLPVQRNQRERSSRCRTCTAALPDGKSKSSNTCVAKQAAIPACHGVLSRSAGGKSVWDEAHDKAASGSHHDPLERHGVTRKGMPTLAGAWRQGQTLSCLPDRNQESSGSPSVSFRRRASCGSTLVALIRLAWHPCGRLSARRSRGTAAA